jgi:molybdopterin-guanine dinucleotide biosynthesis adapter protein
MKIVAFVGASESGKTRLVSCLIPALAAKGLAVSVLKHCGHGFDFGGEGKDSSQFLAAGARAVVLAGGGRTAVLRRAAERPGIEDIIRREIGTADIVLVEGGKSEPGLRKIEVLRAGCSEGLRTPPDELIAVVADAPVAAAVPVFASGDIAALADWLAAGAAAGPGPRSIGQVP